LISNVAVRLLFEQNDQATIDEFLAKVNPILETVKRERGLEDFKVVMDASNNTPETRDRNELYGEIFLKPTKAVEFIGLTFTITPSGASFDNI
jgi:phage tail sheath protein FI